MRDTNREIQELLVDYAEALRDGCIPAYLSSLTRQEAQKIASSREFWDAAEIVRMINSVGFADKAVTPNLSLFISRVDAKITSRLKKTRALPKDKRSIYRPLTKTARQGVRRGATASQREGASRSGEDPLARQARRGLTAAAVPKRHEKPI